jgi:protocatechuate 3,4-dioxygenase beta subunit
MGRRRALSLLGAGLVTLVACSSDGETEVGDGSGSSGPSSTAGPGAPSTSAAGAAGATDGATEAPVSCEPIPEETAGPFPGDGSNGPNVLAESGVVREDITASFGASSGSAAGVPLTLDLTVVDGTTGCAPLAGAAVYAWHCDREGRYSLYSEGAEDENYLRGVQEADADGALRFTSVFPGAYPGRWPHIHFEVYASLDEATGGGRPIATSQLAFAEDVCGVVYASEGYEQSVSNLAVSSLESDSVFRDGVDHQLASASGDAEGVTARLTITV